MPLFAASILVTDHDHHMYHLTTREAEVLDHRAKGLPYKLVADKLGISINTVKVHISRSFEKLGVSSSIEANLKRQNFARS